jgi:serine protease inhibitor
VSAPPPRPVTHPRNHPPSNLPTPTNPHQVFIEVNEEGTEAAAATAVLMMRCAMPLGPPPEVRLDRPFVFGVQHVPTGALLFVGAVDRPDAAAEA